MTLAEVFRFEVEYRLRQPSTWVYALVLFGIPFLMMHAINGSTHTSTRRWAWWAIIPCMNATSATV